MAVSPYNTVDEYLESFGPDVRQSLVQLRNLVREHAPAAEERLSWGAPAYYQNGFLVQFAGYKNHIGFYTSPATIEHFKEELKPYKTNSKNTTQFPLGTPLPDQLIGAMVRFKIEENR